MKIYFAASIRGGRQDIDIYNQIIEGLRKYGEILTEHIGTSSLSEMGEEDKTDKYIHDRDMEWLRKSDFVVAEVTTPSLGVGYEIGRCIELEIPVLCFYRPSKGKSLSAMIRGCDKIKIFDYQNVDEIWPIIEKFIAGIKF